MSLTKLTKDLSIISKLSDEPNDIDGLTADELKAKFDESGNSIKDYLNNTMTSELDTAIEDLGEAVQESYKKPDGGIPKTDLASDVQTSLGKADTALQAGALPAGGTDGDVLVKNGATDYDATWKKTPPQMGSLATIEPTSSASKAYAAGDYLVYNGQLYKVTGAISQDETLTPGGNISVTDVGTELLTKSRIIIASGTTTIPSGTGGAITHTIQLDSSIPSNVVLIGMYLLNFALPAMMNDGTCGTWISSYNADTHQLRIVNRDTPWTDYPYRIIFLVT